MTYYSQDRNTADVRKKRDFGGFAMFCGTFNDAGRIADRQGKSGTVPQNAGHLAALPRRRRMRRVARCAAATEYRPAGHANNRTARMCAKKSRPKIASLCLVKLGIKLLGGDSMDELMETNP